MTTVETVCWARDHLSNVEVAALDDALHLAQESVPEQFSVFLLNWYQKIK
jgi:hypothetical protein